MTNQLTALKNKFWKEKTLGEKTKERTHDILSKMENQDLSYEEQTMLVINLVHSIKERRRTQINHYKEQIELLQSDIRLLNELPKP